MASFNRPGRNITGIYLVEAAMEAKRLTLLRELVPNTRLIGVMLNPINAVFETELADLERAGRATGQQIHVLKVSTEQDIEPAFATVKDVRAGAILVGADPLLLARHEQIVALAARNSVPALYPRKEFVEAGGLASYGINSDESERWVGLYTGRILKGERPSDLPVVQQSKFDFIINIKAAKALGLMVPPTLFALADEVIE